MKFKRYYYYTYNGELWVSSFKTARECRLWAEKHLQWWKDRGFNLVLNIYKKY